MSTAAWTRNLRPETVIPGGLDGFEGDSVGRLTLQCGVHAANTTEQLQDTPFWGFIVFLGHDVFVVMRLF